MAFFDDIGRKISDIGQGAARKTREIADSARTGAAISDEERKINSYYMQLGKLYYAHYADKAEGDLAQLVDSIKASNERIASLREEERIRRGLIKCPKCGTELTADSQFCYSCGAPIPVQSRNAGKTCPRCGEPVEEGMRFCVNCGNPIPPDTAQSGGEAAAQQDSSAGNAYAEQPETREPSMDQAQTATDPAVSAEAEDVSRSGVEESGAQQGPVQEPAVSDTQTYGADTSTSSSGSSQLYGTDPLFNDTHTANVCRVCGAPLDKDALFCTECGARQ